MFPVLSCRLKRWRMRGLVTTVAVASMIAGETHAQAPSVVSLAAASNLVFALESLKPALENEHPEIDLHITTGASGSLVAQIRHGAPFDVFLSADLFYPEALIESGHAQADSLFTFAHGVLCLWPAPSPATPESIASFLTTSPRPRMALANPDTAPFGRAARTYLQAQALWTELEPAAILGENVAQTFHFIRSGNAQTGFVSLSFLIAHPSDFPHHVITSATADLAHGAVLLSRAQTNVAAQTVLAWLASPTAQELLATLGYKFPPTVTLDAPP